MDRTTRWIGIAAAALAACGGYRTVEAPPVEPSIVVTGRVVADSGFPIPGARLAAGSGGSWESSATSDADGAFTLRVSAVPYDLATSVPGSGAVALVYQGVNRTDLAVTGGHVGLPGPAIKFGAVQGSIAALCSGPACAPGSTMGLVAFVPGHNYVSWLSPNAGATPYQATVGWAGSDRLAGRLHVLTWSASPPAQGPVDYWYGGADLTLTAGSTIGLDLPAPQPAATGPLGGTLSVPAGATTQTLWLGHTVAGASVYANAWSGSPSGSSFLFAIPSAVGIETAIWLRGKSASGEFLSAGRDRATAGAADLALALRPAPVLLEPATSVTGVGPGTRFAWVPTAGALHLLHLGVVIVVTGAAEARAPDLSPLGLSYSAGGTTEWTVTAQAMAGPGIPSGVDGLLAPPSSGPVDWWRSTSLPRTFTFR